MFDLKFSSCQFLHLLGAQSIEIFAGAVDCMSITVINVESQWIENILVLNVDCARREQLFQNQLSVLNLSLPMTIQTTSNYTMHQAVTRSPSVPLFHCLLLVLLVLVLIDGNGMI